MTVTKEHIKIGLLVIVTLILIANLIAVFSKKKDAPDRSGELKAKDEVIQSVIRERETMRQWKDEAIAELEKKDSVLKIQYKTTVIKYEKIPADIRRLSNEELRRAVANY